MFTGFVRGLVTLVNRTHLAVVPSRPRRSSKRRWTVRPQLEILASRILPSVDVWTGANHATDINWSDGGNWSTGSTPGAGDIAEFTSNSNDSAVKDTNSVDDISKTIGGLQIDGAWNGTLTIGTLNNPVTLTLASGGTSEWDSGTISLDLSNGSLINKGTLTQNSSNGAYLGGGGTFTNDGTIDQTNTGALYLYGTSSVATTLINSAGSTLDFQADSGIHNNGGAGGDIINAGSIEKTAGAGTSVIGTNSLTNTGTLDAASGTLALDNTASDTNGTFSVASGAILDLTNGDGSSSLTENGTFTGTGAGEILLSAGTLTTGSSGANFNLANTLAFDWTGGTISVPVNATLTYKGTLTQSSSNGVHLDGGGTFINDGVFNQTNAGSLYVVGTSSVATTLINSAGSTLDFQADSGIHNNGGAGGDIINAGSIEKTAGTGASVIGTNSLTNTGTLDAASGTLALDNTASDTNGTFSVASGAILDLTDGDGSSSLTENGTLTVSGAGELRLDAGTLSAGASGATITLPNTVTFAWLGSYINVPTGATLTLNGNLNLNGTSDEYLEGSGTLLEKGTITQSNTGNLAIAGTGSNATTLIIPTGSTYNFAANSGIVFGGGDGGVVTNSGTIEKTATSGSASINVAFNNTGGAINVSKGTLTLGTNGGLSTGGSFNVSSGAILNLTGGKTVAYSGTYTGTGTGEVELGSGTLSVQGGSSGATFNLAKNLFVWSGGTIDTNGNTMTLESTVKINSTNGNEYLTSGNSSGGYLNIGGSAAGVLSFTAAGNTLNIASATTLDITSKGTLDLADDTINGGGSVANFGNLIKNTGTSTATISTYLDNEKTVEVQTGTLTLSGTVDQVSGGALTGGTWEAVNAKVIAALNISSASFATIDPGVSVVVNGPYASFANLSAVTVNDGSLSLLGGASLSTTGNFTNAGTLTFTPSTTLNSVLNVGGTFTQTSLGTLSIGFSGTASAPTYGLINSSGAASLAGALKVTSKFKPNASTIDILTYGSESGDFTSKALPSGWSAAPGATDYVLTT